MAFRWADRRLRQNLSFARLICRVSGYNLAHVGPRLQDNRPLVLLAVKNCGRALEHASRRLKDDPLVVATACHADESALAAASGRLRSDRQFILSLMTSGHQHALMRYVSKGLRDDPEFMLEAVMRCEPIWHWCHPVMQNQLFNLIQRACATSFREAAELMLDGYYAKAEGKRLYHMTMAVAKVSGALSEGPGRRCL